MKMNLTAKDDGLWLELRPDKIKKSALIRIGPETRTIDQKGTFIDQVCHEVWQELKTAERRMKITDLEDIDLGRKLWELSKGFENETRWIMEEAIERMGVDLDGGDGR